MKLKNLIKDISFEEIKGSKEILITGLCSNSKLVVPGNLFIARKGKIHDGSKFIEEAINTGAVAVLTDMYNPFLSHITQLIDQDIVSKEITLANRYYQEPSKKIFLVGITGTNGKTTTSYLTRHLFGEASCGLMGTVECIIGEQHFPSTLTTPDVISIHKNLRDMLTRQLSSAVMEVSSHALDQQRVGGVDFDVAIFTNLSQDHLDYHLTMEQYAMAKAKLFALLENHQTAVINIDCPYSSIMQKDTKAQILTYGVNKPADLWAHNIIFSRTETSFSLKYQDKDYLVETNLIGRFNVYNTLAAIGAALCKGLSIDQILLRLRSFIMTKGRLEPVSNTSNLSIYIDYAVTPDALQNVLVTMKELTKGKLYVVFGCGGNRDQSKRPKMGRIAAQEADQVIITSDNPRLEEPSKIAAAILEGVLEQEKVEVILDRKEAIEAALERMHPEDILIIAGKGHEKKQIFSDRIIDFDDKEVVMQILSSKSWATMRS